MVERNPLESEPQAFTPEAPGGSGGGAWLPWLLVAVAVSIRTVHYLIDNSLEVAESELALNLVQRSFAGLLRPLDYDQGAPLGFLWAVKSVLTLCGSGERALRFFPFTCGIAAVFLFKALAQRLLDRFGATLALAMFAVAPMVLWYSVQVKQYSVDVAVTCALLLLAQRVARAGSAPGSALALALAGLVAIPLSHPAVFVLMGVGCALGLQALRRGDRRDLGVLAGVGVAWCGAFAVLYVVFLRNLEHNAYLLQYWSANLMPFPPTTFAQLRWFPSTFFGMFVDPGGFELAEALAAFLFVVGLIELARREWTSMLLLTLPIVVTLGASAAQQYPFGRRLILFLVPLLLLGISAGAAQLRRLTRGGAAFVGPLLCVMLLFEPLVAEAHAIVTAKRYEDIRPALAYLKEHWSAGDTLYLYFDSQYAYRYYAERLDLRLTPVVVGTSSESRWEEDLADMDRLRGRGRVWLLFSHIHGERTQTSEERFFIVHLDRIGKSLESFQATGVALHLYDLAP